MVTTRDEEDFREFISATDKAMSALMRVFDRAERSDETPTHRGASSCHVTHQAARQESPSFAAWRSIDSVDVR